MKQNKPTVVISKISPRWNYFQFFLLGFYQLQKEGKIHLKFDCGFIFFLSRHIPNIKVFAKVLYKLKSFFIEDSYNLEGYIIYNGKKRLFCIDSADAPFLFDSNLLDKVDVYFKMQCPKDINVDRGFRLTDDVYIPYCDHLHVDDSLKHLTDRGERKNLNNLKQNITKIKPCVVGFRQLSLINSYKSLQNAYLNYKTSITVQPKKKAMCYFGNALGPVPTNFQGEKPDWDWESDIMGYYSELLNHPNEKRHQVSMILKSMGADFDARVISDHYADKESEKRTDLIVPLDKFCSHISNFQYNVNVSGYRMSIPNRFMESFIVGTAIVTDKLAVKWYLPFEKEVIETVEMGYLKNESVDWNGVKSDFQNLPPIDTTQILDLYEKKWAPNVVADYIVSSVV